MSVRAKGGAMLDSLAVLFDVFPYAIGAGIIISVVCATLGVFVVLKRVVFIGITLSQTAAAGIALAFMLHLPALLGAGILTLLTVTLLAYPYESQRVPRDAVLGAVFLFSSALSILIVSKSGFGLAEVQALLYGDLIVTSPADFRNIVLILVPVLIIFLVFLRPILFTFLDRDQARVLGLSAAFWEILFFYLLGFAASGASKVGGALLIFCYLTIPAMIGLLLAGRLWKVMLISASVACLTTLAGIYLSYETDLPTNQTIVMLHCGLLAAAAAYRALTPLFRLSRNSGA